MNTRRDLLIVLGCVTVSPRIVLAQAKKRPVLIGWLHGGRRGRAVATFKEGMAALGWKEGVDYVLEERWAEARTERLPVLAEELAARKPAVIVGAVGGTEAAAKAAPNIPVVQARGSSPVSAGLAASLARPGGMVTGVTNLPSELSGKFVELLLDAVPKLKRIGFLVDAKTRAHAAFIKNARHAIDNFRVEARFAEVSDLDELDGALVRLSKEGVEGLIVSPSIGLFASERERIVKFALTQRWPVVAGPSGFADAGALLSYSGNAAAQYRRAAYYVDRILKGAKPGDLPIEQPMTFELVVNMKTATLLGLKMPPEIMVRAERVIE
jgi:putative ABC transport system substrate-binding protein